MLAIAPLETWRLGLAQRAWQKPLKKHYNSTKTAPISESRRGLDTLVATWRQSLRQAKFFCHCLHEGTNILQLALME